MAPIPIEAAQSAFPRIFDGYGSGQLARQVRAFNDLVSAEEFSPHTPGWLAYRLTRVGIKKPHVALLNLLSLLGSDDVSTPPGAALAARIFLLETNLRDLLDRGIPTTTFRDMLRNPSGLDDLIAETDVACRLPRWGQLGAHNPTTKGGASNKNFDISWAWRRWRFNADVKWFETWVLKKGSGTSDLEALLHLVLPELDERAYISLERGLQTESALVDTAVEVKTLYDAARARASTDEIDLVEENGYVVAFRPRRRFPETSVRDRVQDVRVEASPTSDGGLVIFENAVGGADRDSMSARRCLGDAAAQVPAAESRFVLPAIVVGSANYQDVADVEHALFGGDQSDPVAGLTERVPGLFSADTGEVTLAHIKSVFFYSLIYEPLPGTDALVRIRRVARRFDASRRTLSQRLLGWWIQRTMSRSSKIAVSGWGATGQQ